jgi:hypothetical protein
MGTEKKVTIMRVDGQTIVRVDGEEQKELQLEIDRFWDWVVDQGKHNFRLDSVAPDRAYLSFDDERPKYVVEGMIEALEDLNPLKPKKSDSAAE